MANKSLAAIRVLGVDPGLQVTGYGVIEYSPGALPDNGLKIIEAGVIRTHVTSGIALRLEKIYMGLESAISELRPDVLVIERLYAHYKHPATAILMGHVRGVVCLLSGTKNIPLVSIAATHIKKAVTGKGHASKEQVACMAQHYLKLKKMSAPLDVTDALAIALSYVFGIERKR